MIVFLKYKDNFLKTTTTKNQPKNKKTKNHTTSSLNRNPTVRRADQFVFKPQESMCTYRIASVTVWADVLSVLQSRHPRWGTHCFWTSCLTGHGLTGEPNSHFCFSN